MKTNMYFQVFILFISVLAYKLRVNHSQMINQARQIQLKYIFYKNQQNFSRMQQPEQGSKGNQKKNPKMQKIRKQSGISIGFQIIFNQIVGKGIKESEVFDYTAKRLRDFKQIVDRNKLKEQIQKE